MTKKSLLKDNLSAFEQSENPTQATRSGKQTSRFSKSITIKSKIASRKSAVTVSKKSTQLKKEFLSKDDSVSPDRRDSSPLKAVTISKRSSTGAITSVLGELRKSFVRKIDGGNQRYKAEKPMSQAGLLCGMASKPRGFAEPSPSEIDIFKQETELKK